MNYLVYEKKCQFPEKCSLTLFFKVKGDGHSANALKS